MKRPGEPDPRHAPRNVGLQDLTPLLSHERDYHTREEARAEIFEFIEVFYNRQRLHQTLGYVSPEQFETQNPELARV